MEIESIGDAASRTEGACSSSPMTGEINIITAVRLRPMSSAERHRGYRRVVDMALTDGNWVRIVNPVALAPSAHHTPSPPPGGSKLGHSTLRAPPALSLSSSATAASSTVASVFPPQFTQEFHFDHTFWSFDRADGRCVANQSIIYDEIGTFTIENALQGYNCSIFAYGQTSAGKTYTMMGPSETAASSGGTASPQSTAPSPTTTTTTPDEATAGVTTASPALSDSASSSRRGLIPRICRGLFDRLEERDTSSDTDTYAMHLSYIEIYHERAYDLLQAAAAHASGGSLSAKESLKVRESPKTGVFVERANQVRVTSFADIKLLVDEGNRVRSVAATSANARSSRSHAILTLTLQQSVGGVCRQSKICLVDLAGSERADVSGTNGAQLREAGSVNKSLATLADVISALSKRLAPGHGLPPPAEPFVPFRNSILTRLLKESLGGNAKTILLAAISPCCAHYEESLSTLKYIERAKSVVNVARVNVLESSPDSRLVDALRWEVTELKAKLQTASAHHSVVASWEHATSSLGASHRDDDLPDEPTASSGVSSSLALQLNDELSSPLLDRADDDASKAAAGRDGCTKSPLYTASICFDEREKAKLERDVAKLKVQLRKREREFQVHEFTSKALSERVAVQLRLFRVASIHETVLVRAKLRAFDRWRFFSACTSVRCDSSDCVVAPGDEVQVVDCVPLRVDKNVTTDPEEDNNVVVDDRAKTGDAKCPVCAATNARVVDKDENPALCDDDDDELGRGEHKAKGELVLDAKSLRAIGVRRQQVDVLCSSIVGDFFGHHTLVAASNAKKSSSRDTTKCSTVAACTSENNQWEPIAQLLPELKARESECENDPSNEEHERSVDTGDEEDTKDALVAAIIDHDTSESNQLHEAELTLSLAFGDDLESIRDDVGYAGAEDDADDSEDDDDELEGADGEDAGTNTPSDRRQSQQQRVQSKLARCQDAIDIVRKAMGPTVRRLKQIADKENCRGFQVGTGLERQLLTHADRSFVKLTQHVADLSDSVATTAATRASSRLRFDCALYGRFESLVSDFCLQTMCHVCDQLTLGAAGTSVLARNTIEKQLDGFERETKELVGHALCSVSAAPLYAHNALLVAALLELFGLSERIRFAWYAIDQKNRQRLLHFQVSQQPLASGALGAPAAFSADIERLKAQNAEVVTTNDLLVAQLAAQTAEFARREEEDRVALLLATHKLEQEHDERVGELESALEIADTSIRGLKESVLAHASRVERLEQELELTSVVRTANALLRSDSDLKLRLDYGDSQENVNDIGMCAASAPDSPSASQRAHIIGKLEEELASALTQISELESSAATSPGGRGTHEPLATSDDATTVDQEMIAYMERTSEIEKQNNEAIDRLGATAEHAYSEQEPENAVRTNAAPDAVVSSPAVAKVRYELSVALERAEVLEEQHMKLMVSFESQTDTVLHLEEELYDAHARLKEATQALAASHERVSVLELDLTAAQELTRSLQSDVKDIMSELCVTECKCGDLEARCSDLGAHAEQSAEAIAQLESRIATAQQQLTDERIRASDAVEYSEAAAVEAEARCVLLELVSVLLEERCVDIEQGSLSTANDPHSLQFRDSIAEIESRLLVVKATKHDVHDQCLHMEDALQTASAPVRVQDNGSLASDRRLLLREIESVKRENAPFQSSERAARDWELSSAQTRVLDLEVRMAELDAIAEAQLQLIDTLESDLEAASEKVRMLTVAEQQQRIQHQFAGDAREQVNQLERQCSELREACDELRSQLRTTNAHCGELESASGAMVDTATRTSVQLATLEQQAVHQEALVCELQIQLTNVTTANAELEAQVSDERALNAALASASAAAAAQQYELQEQCRFLNELTATHKTKLSSLAAELTSAFAQYDDLLAAYTSVTEQQQQSSEASSRQTATIAELESHTQALESQLQAASGLEVTHQEAVAVLRVELATAHAHIESLQEQQRSLEKELNTVRESHAGELDALQQSLDNHVTVATLQAATTQLEATNADCTTKGYLVQSLEEELERTRLQTRRSEEAHDAQTLLLAEVQEAFTVARTRATAFQAQLEAQEAIALEATVAAQHHERKLLEAQHAWHDQHQQTHYSEMNALKRELETKLVLLTAELSERETSAQNLQVYLERTQSSHAAELEQRERKHQAAVIAVQQHLEDVTDAAQAWELKYHALERCVSPDEVRKTNERIDAATRHAAECEATYKVELEHTLQLEFDLASVKKELKEATQQLVRLQGKERESDSRDPAAATLRSQARAAELATLESERRTLQAQCEQVTKREAAVRLRENSAQARLDDAQHHLQTRSRELEAAAAAQTAELVQSQSQKRELEVRVARLTQALVEAIRRGEMQREELWSVRSWMHVEGLLQRPALCDSRRSGADDLALKTEDDEPSLDATQVLHQHLDSLDSWFEHAILGTPDRIGFAAGCDDAPLFAATDGWSRGAADVRLGPGSPSHEDASVASTVTVTTPARAELAQLTKNNVEVAARSRQLACDAEAGGGGHDRPSRLSLSPFATDPDGCDLETLFDRDMRLRDACDLELNEDAQLK